jgi:hypothetical protein
MATTRTTTRIPTSEELASRLAGIDGLLTAKQWERAAIVFAYTQVQTGRRNGRRPTPPRMNLREFARHGYAGLTTNKSVEHYRNAWIRAIEVGQAAPVGPGDTTYLPTMPFPSWASSGEPQPRQARSAHERVFEGIETAALALRRMPFIADEDLTPDLHRELRVKLQALRVQADEALALLQARQPVKAERHLSRV